MAELSCNEALQELSTFLDGELDDARRRELADHLERCGHCHGVHDFEHELRRVISAAAAVEVPPELRQRILDRIRAAGH